MLVTRPLVSFIQSGNPSSSSSIASLVADSCTRPGSAPAVPYSSECVSERAHSNTASLAASVDAFDVVAWFESEPLPLESTRSSLCGSSGGFSIVQGLVVESISSNTSTAEPFVAA